MEVTHAPVKKFLLAAAFLALLFSWPLLQLFRFAARDDLHSYVVLIPFLCLYLGWLRLAQLPAEPAPARGRAWAVVLAGVALAVWYVVAPRPALADRLAQAAAALALFWVAAGFWCLGAKRMRVLAFPFALLIFMVPLPDAWRDAVETALQHGSALVAGWMFTLSGLPVFQDGMTFRLPTINLQVAPECSGIHSTLVLFITSLVAASFFLRAPWRRAVLCLVIIPLALLRNGFRIFVLGELCTRVGPQMIDSPIHHRGGPVFFALSLIPFGLLLWWLRRTERKAKTIS